MFVVAPLSLMNSLSGKELPLNWPELNRKNDSLEKKVSSLEDLSWMSSKGASFYTVATKFDCSEVLMELDDMANFIAQNHGSESYLPLMLLISQQRHVDTQLQAQIMCAYLDDFEYLDEWSWIDDEPLECNDSFVARHLVSLNEDALTFLLPLLQKRTAMQYGLGFGSEGYSHADRLRIRKCDLTARYVSQILGLEWTLHRRIQERDVNIQNLIKAVEKKLTQSEKGGR